MAIAAKVEMTPVQFEKLGRIIYDRSGIHFPIEKKYILESRLCHRLGELELDDFDQYIAFLTMGPYQTEEFQEMFNRITINETSFFRHEAQLEAFERRVLPGLIEARATTKRLRIWSAACSSGEEPFTLAIMLNRTLGLRVKDWSVEILGSDISERALRIAAGGRYTDYAMRSTPDLIRSRYFRHEGRDWILSDEIRQMVNFETHNLRDTLAAKRHGTWDVIFCRNVMIYFDGDMKRRVLRCFADQLADDGALFIGHSESVRDAEDSFSPVNIPHAFCYQPARSAATRAA